MALTEFQRIVCQLLAQGRIASGESYVAGGAALNELIGAPRQSRDLDLFHDTVSALAATWKADEALLLKDGFVVTPVRERPAFVEAEVRRGDETVLLQWVHDSAYRFFPLVEHPEFGLTMHPFDLATNKILALVSRLEVRDWIDVIESSERIQPLGFLAWAASAKDPGFSPPAILDFAARSTHYSVADVASLAFEGPPPDTAQLAGRWQRILVEAREVIATLPPAESGKCILDSSGHLFRGTATAVSDALAKNLVGFHAGRIRGAMPTVVSV